MAGTGDKLLTAAEIKEVTDTKVDKDFSALTALPNGLSDTDLINVRRSGTNYKLSGSDLAPTPLVASITTGQWSGSGSDYYITVTASNVTADSILSPTYDHTSDSRLKGPVWCVPAAGSFTIHTSAIPTGTVTIMVQFVGTLGEAQYQVLADVYSKSQTDALIAQSTATTHNRYNHANGAVIDCYRSGNIVTVNVTNIGASAPLEQDKVFYFDTGIDSKYKPPIALYVYGNKRGNHSGSDSIRYTFSDAGLISGCAYGSDISSGSFSVTFVK